MSEAGGPPSEGQQPYGQPQQPYGQPYGQLPAYGTAPGQMPPGYAPIDTPKGPAPTQVETAVRLMFGYVVLSIVSFFVSLSLRDEILNAAIARTGLNDATARSAANIGYTFGIALSVIFILLYGLMALQVRKGKNWARITTIVFAALGLLGGLNALSPTTPGVLRVLGLVSFVLNLGILLLLARRPASDYFKPRPYGY